MDGKKTLNFSSKLPSFDKKNTHSLFIIGIAVLLVGGYGVAQSSQGYDVEIGQNGIKMYSGTLDVQGNDIENSGTTVFDGSAGQIATAVVDYSAATASDVGLGNVENIALSTIGGNDIAWNSNNNVLDVDSSSIQSGTTASDVGLGNVDNTNELDLDGSESMNGELDMNAYDISGVDDIQANNANARIFIGNQDDNFISDDITLDAGEDVVLRSDANSNNYECVLDDSDGVFTCPQGKSWVHEMNKTHEAVYNSHEGMSMRAVYEGSVSVDSMVNVSLPKHFTKTVSDTEPQLRAVATPDELATIAVTEKTSEYIIIESSESVNVDFSVTGVRDGFEDREVVREKE